MTLVDSTSIHDGTFLRPGAPEPLLTLRTAHRDGVYVVAPYGELDLSTTSEVRRALDRAEASDAAEIVLDLSGLRFIDSSGLHLVVSAVARSTGDRLRLLRGTPPVHRVFTLCGCEHLPFVG
jgi:anti-sigma B factor antagonist